MKHKEMSDKVRNSVYYLKKERTKVITQNESYAFMLHDSGLTPGFHCVQQKDGMALPAIIKGLQRMNVSSEIGFLSLSKAKNIRGKNILNELVEARALTSAEGFLEEYLLCSFAADILLIDATPELLKEEWFGKFESLLTQYEFHESMSIIFMFYE